MKKKILFAISLAAGVAIMSLAADPAGGKLTESDSIRDFRAQITELRAEVSKLHQQTQTLESTVEELKRSRIAVTLNPQPAPSATAPPALIPSPIPSRPPTVWGQREVNGWTYYIVPCEQQSR